MSCHSFIRIFTIPFLCEWILLKQKQFVRKKDPIWWETKYNNEILFGRQIGAIHRQHFCCVCFYTLVIFAILTPPKRERKKCTSTVAYSWNQIKAISSCIYTHFDGRKKMIFHYHNRWQTDGSTMIKPHTNINYVWFGSPCGGWTHRLRRHKIKNSQFINSHVYEREGGSREKKMKKTQMTDRTHCLLQHVKVLQTLNWS